MISPDYPPEGQDNALSDSEDHFDVESIELNQSRNLSGGGDSIKRETENYRNKGRNVSNNGRVTLSQTRGGGDEAYENGIPKRTTSNDEPKPNLIVNYLPQSLTDREFFHLFAPYGEMESIKIMRDSQTGYSFGYGFVNYIILQDAIDARNALNGTQLGHKRIKVSFARPPSDDIKDTNLFVTGLPTTITEEELDEMFSPFGIIVHLRVLRDKQTKATRGVAFVRYETRSEACSAILEMNGVIPLGGTEPIRVRLAQDHGKQKAAYLAGYQAALKLKTAAIPLSARTHSDSTYRRSGSESAYDLRRRMIQNRSRPMTACVAGTSISDPALYWKGFIQGSRGINRPESASSAERTSERMPSSRTNIARY